MTDYEHAQDALRRTARQWTEARACWERDGCGVASYGQMVRPWAEAYERRMRDAIAAWREL